MDLLRSNEGFQHAVDEIHYEEITKICGGGCHTQNMRHKVCQNLLGITTPKKAKESPMTILKWIHTTLEGFGRLYKSLNIYKNL